MKSAPLHIILSILTVLLANTGTQAQTATCVGLVLKTDSTDGVLMPQIIQILPNTAAAAEPDIKEGMYVLRANETYGRNAPLKRITDVINGDEEGTPVGLIISNDKNIFPERLHILKRGAGAKVSPDQNK